MKRGSISHPFPDNIFQFFFNPEQRIVLPPRRVQVLANFLYFCQQLAQPVHYPIPFKLPFILIKCCFTVTSLATAAKTSIISALANSNAILLKSVVPSPIAITASHTTAQK